MHDNSVNAIYLCDDRMIITFNYKEGAKTVTFADIENTVNSSDTNSPVPKNALLQKDKRAFFLL